MLESEYGLIKSNNLKGILFIVGGDDKICTVKEIKALKKKAKCSTSLYISEGTTIKNTLTGNKAKYFDAIKKFTK